MSVRNLCRIILVGAGAAIAVVGLLYWQFAPSPPQERSARSQAPAPAPVSVATVTRQDVPIHLSGLGTVQASLTVGIRSQVDGKLQEVLFTEGQRVRKGDVLAKIDPRLFQAALDQAIARKRQNAALLAGAEKDLARSKALAQKDIGTQQNVDQQQAKVDQLKASIEADMAAIATAQTQLNYATIAAPSDGRMGVRLVDPGNLIRVSESGPIATLVQIQPAAVQFTLPARVLPDLREAMARGPVEVTAFDQDNRRALDTGTILLIDNVIDQATDMIRLKAMFANADDQLWPGQYVNARVLVAIKRNVLTIPSSAVQRGPQGLFAWIVTSKNNAEPRPLQVGLTTSDLTVVASGLSEGERVVIDGHYRLRRGALVSIAKPQSVDARSGS
ncbi:efflux RND transporter periplasmic adaptor subunit (plasmid) [Azospirillum sp. TSA2s]|uniref:efflux RND transporter periplasmic adaptor subunit n=1 Tax=Azospirillum sp. TSA2s TaxID=709810 RepID=UPI0010A9E5C4|nr:efflux RND transporter periplasmic adaptor subunit [Azospirillum sp. TSA2s]QCG99138.1 efflux RND transporter periplasmic adaptor subunit [Azospirillum sp. TSA2s]